MTKLVRRNDFQVSLKGQSTFMKEEKLARTMWVIQFAHTCFAGLATGENENSVQNKTGTTSAQTDKPNKKKKVGFRYTMMLLRK